MYWEILLTAKWCGRVPIRFKHFGTILVLLLITRYVHHDIATCDALDWPENCNCYAKDKVWDPDPDSLMMERINSNITQSLLSSYFVTKMWNPSSIPRYLKISMILCDASFSDVENRHMQRSIFILAT